MNKIRIVSIAPPREERLTNEQALNKVIAEEKTKGFEPISITMDWGYGRLAILFKKKGK